MKKIIKISLIAILAIYLIVCGVMFMIQESLIFHPEKLDKEYQFQFGHTYEEMNFKTNDGTDLNGLLFKADSSKGLIFYLHGNTGSIASCEKVVNSIIDINYDIFIIDYRSFGKSEGELVDQEQIYGDVQIAYNEMKKLYPEENIIIMGYSIGSGIASKLASVNNPKRLILQAPYYSLIDMMRHEYPLVPTFILKYKFETNKYLKDCKMPITLFHGDKDEVIYYGSSLKLVDDYKEAVSLVTLKNQGHMDISSNEDFIKWIKANLVTE